MNETYTANLSAIKSLKRRLEIMDDCHKAQQAALRDPAFANKQREVQQQKEESESRSRALQEEMRLREELAKSQMPPELQKGTPHK
jgi:hypothetical protein